MASAPIAQIPTLPGMDVHPPGYFAALHVWMDWFGRSEFALRYLSLVLSLLTLASLIRFGRMVGGARAGLWTGLLTALSPCYVAYAQEVRMYAMLTCLAAASVYYLWQLCLHPDNQNNSKVLIAYIITTTLTLYTHYFTIFLLCFENLLWLMWFVREQGVLWRQRLKRLGYWVGAQLAILLLFSPQLRLASRQVTTYANPNLNPPTLLYYITHNWQAYTLGLTFNPTQAQPYLWALALLLVGGLVFYLRPSTIGPVAVLAGWFVIPLTLYFVVLQSRPSYQPRYMMLITPALFLLFGLAFSPKHWGATLLGVGGLAIFALGLHSYFTDPAFFKDDAEAVTQWLTTETTPSDIVLVDVPHPFHYYANRIPADTHYLFVDIQTAADTLSQMALGKNRLYWITWWGSDTDPRGVIPFLAQKQAGFPEGERQFKGYRVVWYNLTDRPFSLPTTLPAANVNFDNVLLLDGLAYSQTLSPGQAGWATLHFSQLSQTDINYKISLRLRAPDGRLLAQDDRVILNDRHFQTAAWPIEDPQLNQATNVYTLPLNDPTYTGPLTLEAVVYNAESLAAIAAYGVPTTNNDSVSAQIGEMEVKK